MPALMTSEVRTLLEIYEYLCQPLARKYHISQGELNILLFLDIHPQFNTAHSIQQFGGMKQSIISTMVNKLVEKGYLERFTEASDRRKIILSLTDKARPVLEEGKQIREHYLQSLTQGLTDEEREIMKRIFAIVSQNISTMRKEMLEGVLKR